MADRSPTIVVLYTILLAVVAWVGGTLVRQALISTGTPVGRAGNVGGLVALSLFIVLAVAASVRALVAE